VIRQRPIVALVSAEIVSRLGSQLTELALPWFVLVTTGSATKMGLVFAVELLPVAVLGIPSGAVVQRLGARTSMLIADFVRAPLVALVPLLHELGGLSFGVLLAIAAAHGLFSTAYFTCQRLILPEVVGEDEHVVAQANTVIEGATNVTQFAGPALAGLFIAWMGAANVLWLDAASYAISFAVVLAFVRARGETPQEEEARGLWAGLRYLRRDRLVAQVSVSSLVYGFMFRILTASFPVLAYEEYDRDPRVAGWLAASFGVGAVTGSLLSYRLVTRTAPLRMAAVASLFLAAPLWLLVPHVPLGVTLAALAVCGASIPAINAPYLGMLSTRVPRALRAKVLQSLITINNLAGPLGYVVAGPLFVHAGLHPAYAVCAALATAATLNFVVTVLPEARVAQEAA
jgi:predicted MFS family arabinose efflux permease